MIHNSDELNTTNKPLWIDSLKLEAVYQRGPSIPEFEKRDDVRFLDRLKPAHAIECQPTKKYIVR
jgi:hypothetical protein